MASWFSKLAVAGLLLGGLLLAVPNSALAHTLAKDGKISAFMHIDPDDKPQAGKTNSVHFYFNDQDFRFSMEGCDCSVKISQASKILYKGVLPASGTRVGEVKVYLPINNFSYDVVVNGTPKTGGFFQPFKLVFDIDVGNPPEDEAPPPTSKVKVAIGIGAVVLAAGGTIHYLKRHKRAKIKE